MTVCYTRSGCIAGSVEKRDECCSTNFDGRRASKGSPAELVAGQIGLCFVLLMRDPVGCPSRTQPVA